jgi:hypothetical protein
MSTRKCRLCNRSLKMPESMELGVCKNCRAKTGIGAMPPARRKPRPCGRCNGMRFVRVIPREYSQVALTSRLEVGAIPMAVTNHVRRGEIRRTADSSRGLLETYICTSCGFVEWYCNDPESIPIGPEYMSEIVDVGGGPPYR